VMTMQQVGEVIQSGTGSFVAQSYSVNEAPPFGSLVRARLEGQETTIYGVVSKIETSPLDPSRRPVARGQEAGSLAEIYQDHPQLKELFRTEFTATVVGHARDGSLYHHLPPLPPEIHQLVYSCADEEVAAFTRGFGFLPLLLAGQGTIYSTVGGPASFYPDAAQFVDDYTARYGDVPLPYAAQAYDATGICLEAIKAAVEDSGGELPVRQKVASTVRGTAEYPGITGALTFNARGDLKTAKYFMIRVVSADPKKWHANKIEYTLDFTLPAR